MVGSLSGTGWKVAGEKHSALQSPRRVEGSGVCVSPQTVSSWATGPNLSSLPSAQLRPGTQ